MEDFNQFSHDIKFTYEFDEENISFLDLKVVSSDGKLMTSAKIPLSAKITKWSNTFKQFVGNLPTNCLSVFDHFVGMAL